MNFLLTLPISQCPARKTHNANFSFMLTKEIFFLCVSHRSEILFHSIVIGLNMIIDEANTMLLMRKRKTQF